MTHTAEGTALLGKDTEFFACITGGIKVLKSEELVNLQKIDNQITAYFLLGGEKFVSNEITLSELALYEWTWESK